MPGWGGKPVLYCGIETGLKPVLFFLNIQSQDSSSQFEFQITFEWIWQSIFAAWAKKNKTGEGQFQAKIVETNI